MKAMKFLDMFSDYTPCKGDLEKLDCLYIRSAEIDYPQGAIYVELETENYISARFLQEIAREVEFVYSLRRLDLNPHYPASELGKMDPAELQSLFVGENSM